MHKKLAAIIVALSMTSAALAGCGAAQQAAAPVADAAAESAVETVDA